MNDQRDFSIWCENGNYVHYARMADENPITNPYDYLYYRRGALNSDGSITWSADEQLALQIRRGAEQGRYILDPHICVLANGRPMIGYCVENSGYTYPPYVTMSSRNDGIWETHPAFPYAISSTLSRSWNVQPVPHYFGGATIVYGGSFGYLYDNTHIYIRPFYGCSNSSCTWGDEIICGTTLRWNYDVSCVTEGNYTHIFCASSGWLGYIKYDIINNIISDSTDLGWYGNQPFPEPTLTIDRYNNNLYAMWVNTPNHHTSYMYVYDTESNKWYGPLTLINEVNEGYYIYYYHYGVPPSDTWVNWYLSAPYETYDEFFGIYEIYDIEYYHPYIRFIKQRFKFKTLYDLFNVTDIFQRTWRMQETINMSAYPYKLRYKHLLRKVTPTRKLTPFRKISPVHVSIGSECDEDLKKN
jgi:hypothetical protein